MGMRVIGFLGLFLGWQASLAGATVAGDDVLESKLAECRDARDGDCLLQIAAFEEAAAAFEQTARWDRAAHVRAQLGHIDRAYTDELAFVKTSGAPTARQSAAADALALAGLLGDDKRAELVEFYRRYLRNFASYAARDSMLVAHARLGTLLMAQSCPIRVFHGGCVEIHREARNCQQLCDKYGACPSPISWPTKPGSGTYTVEIAVAEPRDPRLVSEAGSHLRSALDTRSLAAAEAIAATLPARARALANAKAAAVFARALPDLDRFLSLGGSPEDLDFETPTEWDSPCEAERKTASFNLSSQRFSRWLREKLALMDRLRKTYLKAATDGGPEGAVVATALYAFVMASTSRALLAPNDQLDQCPVAGFVHPPGDPWADDVDHAASLCDLLASRYAIDTQYSRYCRIDLYPRPGIGSLLCRLQPGRRCHRGSGLRSATLMTEVSSSALFMDHVRDDEEALSFEIPVSSEPPRDKPKSPQVPCSRKRASAKPATGVLRMSDGSDLARYFSDGPRFPAPLPDQLAERFPPPFAQ